MNTKLTQSEWEKIGKDNGYDQKLQDRFYKEGRINGIEEVEKEIKNTEQYSLGDDSANVGYMYCKKDILQILKNLKSK